MTTVAPTIAGAHTSPADSACGIAYHTLLQCVLASYVLESPLRYALNLVGAEPLLYLRDVVLALLVAAALVSSGVTRRTGSAATATVAVAAHGLAGWLLIGSPMQVLLGMKIFLPFLAGMAGHRLLVPDGGAPVKVYGTLWVLACGGVLADFWLTMPWEGLAYTVMGHEVAGNRAWFAGELTRLAGFSRASYEAAVQVLVLGIVILRAVRATAVRVGIGLTTAAVIALTTTKGVLMAFAVVAVALLAPRAFLRPLILAAGIVCALLPALAVVGVLSFGVGVDDVVFGSLSDRIRNTWPGAFAILAHGHYVLGGGLGSIGVPLDIFHPTAPNPGDNLFVYLAVAFGVFALPYFMWLVAAGRRLAEHDRTQALLILACLVAGVTMSVIEGAFWSLFLGAALGRAAELSAASFSNLAVTYASRGSFHSR